MANKFGAQRCWWHPKVGYVFNKDELYVQSGIQKDEFQVFDSRFEAKVHEALNSFVSQRFDLLLFSQIAVDLSKKFCNLSYRIDFLIVQRFNPKGKKHCLNKDRGLNYKDIIQRPDIGSNILFVEAKGFFMAEARYKHLLLEWAGITHGENCEIVQQTAQHVSRGTKCYKTLTLDDLLKKLNQRYP